MSRRVATALGPVLAGDAAAGLLCAAGILIALGAVMVFSATAPLAMEATVPPHFLRHVAGLGIGIAVGALASRLPLAFWYRTGLPFWVVTVVLLALVPFFGVSAGGARRWLELPGLGLRFQPAELAKLATLVAVAALLSRRDGRAQVTPRRFGLALGLAGLPAVLCLAQPDLGNAVLLLVLTGLLLFVAGAPLRAFVLPGALGSVFVAVYSLLNPYALRRWLGFLDPWARSREEGFQLVQSFVAFGRGGSVGVGLGDGRQKLHYLPEAHTDFILSVVAEELGLLGVLVVLGAFAAICVAGLRLALRARHRFAMLLAFGMTTLLTVPAALNAAVVMGLLPTKGLTLPLLSYGRSSLLVCCLAVGVLIGLARAEREEGDS